MRKKRKRVGPTASAQHGTTETGFGQLLVKRIHREGSSRRVHDDKNCSLSEWSWSCLEALRGKRLCSDEETGTCHRLRWVSRMKTGGREEFVTSQKQAC